MVPASGSISRLVECEVLKLAECTVSPWQLKMYRVKHRAVMEFKVGGLMSNDAFSALIPPTMKAHHSNLVSLRSGQSHKNETPHS